MSRRHRRPEEIINKLREGEVGLASGRKMPEVCKQLGVTEQAYYRWRGEYGGLTRDEAKAAATPNSSRGALPLVAILSPNAATSPGTKPVRTRRG